MIKPTTQVQRYMKIKVGGYVDKANAKPAGLRYDLGESGELAPEIEEALSKLNVSKLIAEYPDSSYSKLIRALCKKYKLKRNNITIGTGANEILERVARTYLGPKDRCVVIHPTFYRIEDATVRYTPNIIDVYLKEENKYYMTDVELSEIKSLKNIKLIWICTPNNPTGTIVSHSYIKQIASAHTNTLICVDEAHGEYVKNKSATTLLKDYKNIVIIKSLSKALGLPGLRIGYALGHSDLIAPLQAMRLEFPVNSIAAELACIALASDDHVKKLAKDIAKERTCLELELSKLEGISYVPSKTNIISVRHAKVDIHKSLLSKGILVTNMNNLKGVEGKKYVRITIQRQHKKNKILLNALQGLVAQPVRNRLRRALR